MPPTIRLFAAACLLLAGAAQAQDALRVEQAWARPTVAGQSAGGGFLKITAGSTPDRLLSASAPVARAVELHTMEMDGNVMRMRAVAGGIDIPAGQSVELKPGGMHMMFMGLAQPLANGSSFPLTLHFAKAGDVQVTVNVSLQATAAGADAHKH